MSELDTAKQRLESALISLEGQVRDLTMRLEAAEDSADGGLPDSASGSADLAALRQQLAESQAENTRLREAVEQQSARLDTVLSRLQQVFDAGSGGGSDDGYEYG